MNWDNVENIRNAQASAQARFDAEHIATQETIKKAMQSEAFQALAVPHLTELESMIFKMRSELIDYIVAHGLVDGLIWDGVLQPVEGGKIVITKELVETITEKLGYYKKDDVERLLGEYLPEHDYVSDPDYIHTDNNYTTEEKDKLSGIEDNAEVNKIIDLVFNGVSVLDDGTRVATITITPEDIKTWYESNPNTNAFTDSEKSKLAGISDGAEVNRVDDVLVDGRSVLDDSKKAKVTKEIIKTAYESNPDTNAFTDSEKQKLADLDAWKPEAQKAIDANAQGVTEAKTSISELGDEVNSVAGRVTTLENTKLSVITVTDEKIKDLAREGFADGFYNLELEFKAVFKDAENHQRTFNGVQLFGYGLLSGGYIGAGSCLYGAYQSAASGLLQSTSFIMNDNLSPVLQFVLDSSKDSGFIPASVTLSEYSLGVGTAYQYIPYTGATQSVDLNAQALKNIATPTEDADAATKQYVDEHSADLSSVVPYTGATQSVDLNAQALKNIATPTEYTDAATKGYVDSATQNRLYTYTLTYAGPISRTDAAKSSACVDFDLSISLKLGNKTIKATGPAEFGSDGLFKTYQMLRPNGAGNSDIIAIWVMSASTTKTTFKVYSTTQLTSNTIDSYTLYSSDLVVAYNSSSKLITPYSGNTIPRIAVMQYPNDSTDAASKYYVDEQDTATLESAKKASAYTLLDTTSETLFEDVQNNCDIMTFHMDVSGPTSFTCLKVAAGSVPTEEAISVSTGNLRNIVFVARRIVKAGTGYYPSFETDYQRIDTDSNISVKFVVKLSGSVTSAEVTSIYKYEDFSEGSSGYQMTGYVTTNPDWDARSDVHFIHMNDHTT